MKRVISLLFVLMLVFSLAMPAMAATVNANVTNNTGHNYKAYQIFSGSQAEGQAMLGGVEWGSGIMEADYTNLLNAVTAIVLDNGTTPFKDCTDAADVAKVLSDTNHAYQYNTPEALAFAKVVHNYAKGTAADISNAATSTVELEPGYYLLKYATGEGTGTDTIVGLSLLQITGDTITINSKTSFPAVTKKVQDEPADQDVTSTANSNGWGNTADHEIGESFQFGLQAIIPTDVNISYYNNYKVIFHDTMSAGITFEGIDSVYVNGAPVTNYVLSNNAVFGAADISWTLTIEDIKPCMEHDDFVPNADGSITVNVIYNAHLNENAVAADRNAVGIESGNRNEVWLEYSNEPNANGTGETPKDYVWIFTYKIDGTKYKTAIQETNKLAGAGFTLYTAEEYAKLSDNNDETSAVPVSLLKNAADGYYYPVAAGTDKAVTEIITQDDGAFKIKGLDTGAYVLAETTVPSGYNKCNDIDILINASHKEEPGFTAVTHITMYQDETSADDLKIDVINQAGAILPETGGIGTTIFYIVGAVLVLGAVVMLITKKRMAMED